MKVCVHVALISNILSYDPGPNFSFTTVDSRYLEFQGTHWNTSRYPYFDISELKEWEKQ